jgi:lipoyl(octanoyl) transferase
MNLYDEDWGLVAYAEAWKRQTELFDALIAAKLGGLPYRNRLIVCSHPHVYTLGKSGHESNLLLSKERLQSIDATYFAVDRGGDITYHGPGQTVCYPILNLEDFGLGLREYVTRLEEAVIATCAHYGVRGERVAKATGVWIDASTPRARKICAIGVRSSRFVTMHGLALNVNTDLRYFEYINPCGFTDKGVTSLQNELKTKINEAELRDILKNELHSHLEC